MTEPAGAPLGADPSLEARLDDLRRRQRAFFATGATRSRRFREEQLAALRHGIRQHERRLVDAVYSDLRKCESEAYATEIGVTLAEIRHSLKHLGKWMRRSGGLAPLVLAPSSNYVVAEPLGLNLIIAAWNYPYLLSLTPLVGAIAAGNVAVLKPSELAEASSSALAELLRSCFSDEYVAVVEGDAAVSQSLLRRPWDHIFFTGSTAVGRIVARAGAEHLSRVTLELGGKSPAIVMPSADLDIAARRLVWGKFTNAGQTCVAPDYLLVHDAVHDPLLGKMRDAMREFYGADPRQSADFGRIINGRHFQRLRAFLGNGTTFVGGESVDRERYIAPTVLTDISMQDPVMADEIFGPILPVLRISSLNDAVGLIEQRPNPLALYLFTREEEDERQVIERVPFGGGCINNAVVHLGDSAIPFGGVGASGQGAYHGKYSFDVFSHYKGVLHSGTFIDPTIKYPPYSRTKLSIIRRLLG